MKDHSALPRLGADDGGSGVPTAALDFYSVVFQIADCVALVCTRQARFAEEARFDAQSLLAEQFPQFIDDIRAATQRNAVAVVKLK